MDPIHPISPVAPNIPPVTPTPLIGRIDRDDRRRGMEEERRRRRQPGAGPSAEDHAVDQRDRDDDSGLHINVTA